MEDIRDFSKGMNKDLDNMAVDNGFYTHAENITISGPLNSISRDKKFEPENILNYPTNLKLIGMVELNGDLIVFHTDDYKDHRIGIIESGITYVEKLVDERLYFSSEYQIDCVARVLYDGDRIVYFTDYKNPPRQFNLDFVYSGDVIPQLSLYGDFNIPITTFKEQRQNGDLFCGVYQFAARY